MTYFSDDYELEFELYVERTRVSLDKVIQFYKEERSIKTQIMVHQEEKHEDGQPSIFIDPPQHPTQGENLMERIK